MIFRTGYCFKMQLDYRCNDSSCSSIRLDQPTWSQFQWWVEIRQNRNTWQVFWANSSCPFSAWPSSSSFQHWDLDDQVSGLVGCRRSRSEARCCILPSPGCLNTCWNGEAWSAATRSCGKGFKITGLLDHWIRTSGIANSYPARARVRILLAVEKRRPW